MNISSSSQVNRTLSRSNGGLDIATIAIICALLFSFAITLVTNITVIVIIAKTSALRTCTNAFLVSFAASDIFYAIFMFSLFFLMFFFSIGYISINVDHLQTVLSFAWGLLIHSSNGNLILVSIERWLYISRPFWYQKFVTTKTVKLSIGATWISAFAFNLPYLFMGKQPQQAYFLISHAYFYPALHTACCLMLFLIYSHIAVMAFQQLQKISKTQLQHQHYSTKNSAEFVMAAYAKRPIHTENWKAVKLLIVICGLYFLCVSPYVYYFAFTQVNAAKGKVLHYLNSAFLLLLSLYHCSNFFVYFLKIRKFRLALKTCASRVCCCCCCRPNRVGYGNGSMPTASLSELQTRRELGMTEYTV